MPGYHIPGFRSIQLNSYVVRRSRWYYLRWYRLGHSRPFLPEYERDPLNYLLSANMPMEEIEGHLKDGLELWEVARAVHDIQERGESIDDSQRFIARSADEFGEDQTEFVW